MGPVLITEVSNYDQTLMQGSSKLNRRHRSNESGRGEGSYARGEGPYARGEGRMTVEARLLLGSDDAKSDSGHGSDEG